MGDKTRGQQLKARRGGASSLGSGEFGSCSRLVFGSSGPLNLSLVSFQRILLGCWLRYDFAVGFFWFLESRTSCSSDRSDVHGALALLCTFPHLSAVLSRCACAPPPSYRPCRGCYLLPCSFLFRSFPSNLFYCSTFPAFHFLFLTSYFSFSVSLLPCFPVSSPARGLRRLSWSRFSLLASRPNPNQDHSSVSTPPIHLAISQSSSVFRRLCSFQRFLVPLRLLSIALTGNNFKSITTPSTLLVRRSLAERGRAIRPRYRPGPITPFRYR